MPKIYGAVAAAVTLALATAATPARAQQPDFNAYVLKAVAALDTQFRGGGYDIRKAFTHDIDYGGAIVPKSSSAPPAAPTMCVAAAAEVLMTAINIYAKETGDRSVYTKVPAALWQKGNLLSLKANIFMFAGTGSRGTAHTLARFGMGNELSFDRLKPGDFVNLNRVSGSGHAVVFMGYLDGNGTALAQFGPAVKGFRYFSAQGKGRPDAGFAFRHAYFAGTCPAGGSTPRDCNLIRSSNPALLNVGRASAPASWKVAEALARLRTLSSRAIEDASPGISRALVDIELDRELPDQIDERFSGVTDDGEGQP